MFLCQIWLQSLCFVFFKHKFLPYKNYYNSKQIMDMFEQVIIFQRPSCSWSYGSWIYNYLRNQCLSPLTLWVRILLMVTLCDKVCQWLAAGQWFSPVSPTNKNDRQAIIESGIKHPNPNPIIFHVSMLKNWIELNVSL